MTPLVSIILPTYNRAHCLPRALRSVAAQTFNDWELIVIDDGSTDDTAAVVERHTGGWRRRPILMRTKNGGAARARNVGLTAAKGRYSAFIDSDDVWYPNKLAIQVGIMESRPDVVMTFTKYGYFNDAIEWMPLEVDMPDDFDGSIYPSLLTIRCNVIVTPSVTVKTERARDVGGFNERMTVCEDIDLWRRLTRYAAATALQVNLVGVHNRDTKPGLAFPYIERIVGRDYFYQTAITEDPALKGDYERKLYDELFAAFQNLACHRGDIDKEIAMRRAREILRAGSSTDAVRSITTNTSI